MFYTMCMKCGEQWALGDERSCKCRPKTEAMTQEDVIQMARQAELLLDTDTIFPYAEGTDIGPMLEKFAALVAAAEREKVAAWMHFNDYTTGHGDCIEDLLEEIQAQAAESERWKCAEVAESYEPTCDTCPRGVAVAIRARGEP